MKLKKYEEYPTSKEEVCKRVNELKAYLSTKFRGPFAVHIHMHKTRHSKTGYRWHYDVTCGSLRVTYSQGKYYAHIGSVIKSPDSSTPWRSFEHVDPILAVAGAVRLVRSYLKGMRIMYRDNTMKLQPKTK